MTWQVRLTSRCEQMLREVADRRARGLLAKRIEGLRSEPDKQGKALTGELVGFRSLRAVGQRYRIVYRLEREGVVVLVVGLGRQREGNRRDVYEMMGRWIRLGLLDS